MAEHDGTSVGQGGAMRVIAEKSGAALVSLGLVPAGRLRPFVPESLAVHSLLPGLAIYAVGAFRYTEVRVGQEEGSVRSWRDVIDTAIMVPVRSPDRSPAWFVARLYNTSPEVVAWAAGHRLPKHPARIDWSENGRDIRVRVDSATGTGERLSIRGRRRCGLPAWIWKLGPLRAVARSALLANDAGFIRRFAVGCRSIGRASYCSVSCTGDGITLPAPWFSCGCEIEHFTDFVIEAPRPA